MRIHHDLSTYSASPSPNSHPMGVWFSAWIWRGSAQTIHCPYLCCPIKMNIFFCNNIPLLIYPTGSNTFPYSSPCQPGVQPSHGGEKLHSYSHSTKHRTQHLNICHQYSSPWAINTLSLISSPSLLFSLSLLTSQLKPILHISSFPLHITVSCSSAL